AFYFCFDLAINFIETEKNQAALMVMYHDYIESFLSWETFYYGSGHNQYHLWFLLALIWSVAVLFIFAKARLVRVLFVLSLGLNIYGLAGQSYSFLADVPFDTRDALFFGLLYTSMGALFARYGDRLHQTANNLPDFFYGALLVALPVFQPSAGYATSTQFCSTTHR